MILNPYESPQLEQAPPALATPLRGDDGRLGPQHGLLYLFGVAIAAAADPNIREAVRHRDFPFEWWPLLLSIALDGAAVAAILWLVWQRLRRSVAFPRSFGHWLLLIQGVSFLVDAFYMSIYYRFIPRVPIEEAVEVSPAVEFQVRALYAVLWTAFAAVPWLALRSSRQQRLWIRYGVILLVTPLLNVLWFAVGWEQSELASTIGAGLGFIGLLFLFIATVRDFNHPQQLDQLHWVGVVCQFLLIFWIRFAAAYWASPA